jgi:hypothetical protein
MAKNRDNPTAGELLGAAFHNEAKRMEAAGQLPAFLNRMEKQIPGARQELLDALNDHSSQTGQDGW